MTENPRPGALPAIPQDPRGPRAFFGRRAGKTLHKGQQALYETLLPDIVVDIGRPVEPRALLGDVARLHLEIGYGGGEHLARQAREHPGDGYIGCEVFSGGIGKMLEAIAAEGLDNVRLFPDDVIKLLEVLPDGCLDTIYVLYPDPWPKTRHHKRRLIQPPMLAAFARVLKPSGRFLFATDIEDYANWTLGHVLAGGQFAFPLAAPGAWHQPYEGWVPTRYEQKARRQGRETSFYFCFTKR